MDDHRSIGMDERLIGTLKSRLSVMKIDSRNKPYKLASDVAELIKTLRITPNATTKVTPFEAQFGRKPNTPLGNIATSPKSSNLSWENTKIACLDKKLLTKPAPMWSRDANSEDELHIQYRQHQESQSLPDDMPTSSRQPAATNQTVDAEPVTPPAPMGKRKATTPVQDPQGLNGWDTCDDEFDRQLLGRFL